MTHASLFSGIGGFDLAAEWMGWDNLFHCEWNPFGQKVLKHHFPKSIGYNDITKTDFSIHRGTVDILTGGFPCQPYSLAGKRKGKEDERHLWPEMLRAIREIQPRWVVGENVFGLINWSDGLVFHEVQTDLETAGYEVFPYVLPACAVNAPHRRDRVWFVAYAVNRGYKAGRKQETEADGIPSISRPAMDAGEPNGASISPNATSPDSNGQQRSNSEHEVNTSERGEYAQRNIKQAIMHTNNKGLEGFQDEGEIERKREGEQQFATRPICTGWQNFPTQSPICGGDDGLSTELDGITFSKWRNESIKAFGNAIVPAVAHQIFKSIQQYETMRQVPNRKTYNSVLR
jgi:DNA (cytosine-5)-methyltransferase 1